MVRISIYCRKDAYFATVFNSTNIIVLSYYFGITNNIDFNIGVVKQKKERGVDDSSS